MDELEEWRDKKENWSIYARIHDEGTIQIDGNDISIDQLKEIIGIMESRNNGQS